ncbi:amidase family protein [Mesorhizobium australicum]|uniref:Aspartyl-tRNA(Asn)/glutamyl-tRNA(Gln) amidotransferase subunit A n=1 Tax=Mesorhizobium australicum TaxID=536018 RepID=A0A1X7MSF8_9HYPH|nr:amidase [Mesorhizobium australicum]SMH27760.1 aspartyl-tRNA(Asn)/glutamyl-tRNA(Gln) amidotransferase subunit A [Mesorhizobium australicum]
MSRNSPQARLEASLARIAACEPQVRAFVEYDSDNARAQAAVSGRRPGLLDGVVVGVKDVIDVMGFPTRFGSALFAEAGPSRVDATVVRRLRDAGATLLGKLKTTEFAYTDPTDTDNPSAPGHTPGGSSSGSAAAVAAGMVELALGTQTVGSVCRPAAYCGVPGFKPSTGGLPLNGVAPLAPEFDTVGMMARDMALAIRAWQVCASLEDIPLPTVRIEGLRIGVLSDPLFRAVSPVVQGALDHVAGMLASAGAILVEIDTAVDHRALRADHRALMFRSAALHHGALLERGDRLGPNFRLAIETGRVLSYAECDAARDRLRDARSRLQAHASNVDALLLPPAADVAPEGHASTGDAGLIISWTVMGGPIAVMPVARRQGKPPTAVMLTCLPGNDAWLGSLAIGMEALERQMEIE